ncbi:MAG: DNA polymerase III subunit alpha [Bacteroidota bacterium]
MYINAHTYFSLRYGTLKPTELVEAALAQGIETLVLTDINNTSCSFDFIRACQRAGIKPILGIEFRKAQQLLYLGIAQNQRGFCELNRFLTEHSLAQKPLPAIAPAFAEAYIVYPRLIKPLDHLSEREFIGIRPEAVNALYRSPLLKRMDRLLVWSPITFLDHEGFRTHKILRAIDLNILVTKLKATDCASPNERIYPLEILYKNYAAYPQLLTNTRALLASCSIQMEKSQGHNRQYFSGSIESDFALLSKLAINGCKLRYGDDDPEALAGVKRELAVIRKLGFCCYFLITWDIVRYAKTMGYHHVGRGSGANSIVAYCLAITDVEPMELALYFERFINQFRASPPDFDIDFSWDERDDVIDYIFKRYGKDYTALLATYSTFKGKSIVREVGKTFGLPKHEIDLLLREPEAVERHHGLGKHVVRYGKRLVGFPNHLSIHAGGILISERPLNEHTALQLMPKGMPIVHFDMYGAEHLGFHKFDVLSQRGLGHIKDAVKLIQQNRKQRVDIYDVEQIKQDEGVRQLLRSGQCMGCFYIESPAMRALLSKLQCDTYIHLVAASSIIRPGVAKSGMMREYIRRFHDPTAIQYLHPVFEEHLQETFGVMVYQEDVMKIVHHFSGLDLDESDVLRRVMTGKRKSSAAFHRLKEKYFKNCTTYGYPEPLTQEVWRQIESFSGYSFCKAHSASFATESFQSLFLKAYYPLEFMVAVINNFGGFYRTEYYFHEAKMNGAQLHPPCVNRSINLTMLYGKDIYVGFIHLHQLERKTSHRIVSARIRGGVFQDLEDFVKRVALSGEQLDILIRIGAFRFTGKSKCALLWEKNSVFHPQHRLNGTGFLFGNDAEEYQLPLLETGVYDQAFDELEWLGFPLCSPFDLLEKEETESMRAQQLKSHPNRVISILGYFVARKDVATVNQKRMHFGTWYDREGRFFDTTHFPPSIQKSPFRGKGIYRIRGKVVLDFDFPSIEVYEMEKLPWVKDERY